MPVSPKISFRVPQDIARLIDQYLERNPALSITELGREAFTMFFYGSGGALQGADAGFQSAQRIAHLIAKAAYSVAIDTIPDTYEEALTWAKEEMQRRQQAKRERGSLDQDDG